MKNLKDYLLIQEAADNQADVDNSKKLWKENPTKAANKYVSNFRGSQNYFKSVETKGGNVYCTGTTGAEISVNIELLNYRFDKVYFKSIPELHIWSYSATEKVDVESDDNIIFNGDRITKSKITLTNGILSFRGGTYGKKGLVVKDCDFKAPTIELDGDRDRLKPMGKTIFETDVMKVYNMPKETHMIELFSTLGEELDFSDFHGVKPNLLERGWTMPGGNMFTNVDRIELIYPNDGKIIIGKHIERESQTSKEGFSITKIEY